jgi:hypothetical protein
MTNLNVIRRTTALTGNNHTKPEVPVVPMRTTLKLWGGADVVHPRRKNKGGGLQRG